MREWISLTQTYTYRTLWILGGATYISLSVLCIYQLRNFEGPDVIYYLIATVAAIDIGGYVVGRIWGKHKLWPSVSPSKTWEGALGSLLFCFMTIYAIDTIFFSGETAWKGILILTPTLTVLALLGDLSESAMKRKAGVKDSGTLIPGHGGLFDRVDGLLPCGLFMGSPFLLLSIAFPNAGYGGFIYVFEQIFSR